MRFFFYYKQTKKKKNMFPKCGQWTYLVLSEYKKQVDFYHKNAFFYYKQTKKNKKHVSKMWSMDVPSVVGV